MEIRYDQDALNLNDSVHAEIVVLGISMKIKKITLGLVLPFAAIFCISGLTYGADHEGDKTGDAKFGGVTLQPRKLDSSKELSVSAVPSTAPRSTTAFYRSSPFPDSVFPNPFAFHFNPGGNFAQSKSSSSSTNTNNAMPKPAP